MSCFHFNVNRRGLALASFAAILLCPHLVWAQAGKTADDVPTLKAVKERTDQIKAGIETELASLEQLYMHLHSHPELSYQEEKTATTLAKELKALGFDVATKVGGHGIVGVLRNGNGPTVLIRTDMDGLPVVEK